MLKTTTIIATSTLDSTHWIYLPNLEVFKAFFARLSDSILFFYPLIWNWHRSNDKRQYSPIQVFMILFFSFCRVSSEYRSSKSNKRMNLNRISGRNVYIANFYL